MTQNKNAAGATAAELVAPVEEVRAALARSREETARLRRVLRLALRLDRIKQQQQQQTKKTG